MGSSTIKAQELTDKNSEAHQANLMPLEGYLRIDGIGPLSISSLRSQSYQGRYILPLVNLLIAALQESGFHGATRARDKNDGKLSSWRTRKPAHYPRVPAKDRSIVPRSILWRLWFPWGCWSYYITHFWPAWWPPKYEAMSRWSQSDFNYRLYC